VGVFIMSSIQELNLFRKTPLGVDDGILVFSSIDRYVANYQKIAADHIAAMSPGKSNPFIDENLWKKLEDSTRALLSSYTKPGDRVLDVGVGLGRVLAPLDHIDRYGIDISVDYLKKARSEGIRVALSKIEDMPFVDECFDVVLVTDVLEHVFDLDFCTREILRVLKPGGFLIVRVPYKEDLSPYLSQTLPYELIHLRAFDENSLQLHFGKIHNMQCLEASPVAPYLQGAARLRLKLLDGIDCQHLRASPLMTDPLFEPLLKATEVDSEQFTAWIYQLRDKHPEKYREVEQQLVLGMDINAVFKKSDTLKMQDANVSVNGTSASSVSSANASFWDELCGSQAAQVIGVKDSSVASLKRFDEWYFDFYPYLVKHIPFEELRDKDVLEIGLGYGTVSQRIVECGANYIGLDIAKGPVDMVNHRLIQNNLSGAAWQGSVLEPPFPPESFDAIVAIGCLHHTGNLKAAIAQCHKLLRSGGRLFFMVYYAYSYRRFHQAPAATLRYLMREQNGYRGCVGQASERERAAYDAGSSGAGAPHTDWISVRSLAHYCKSFSQFSAKLENIDQEWPFHSSPREALLHTKWPSRCGLDVYATATK